jgi:predicted ATPase
VSLSRLVDPDLVVPTIAQTLGLKEVGSQPIAETLREHVAGKRHLLLVLDNFEHVVGAASEVAALLATSPGLRVLVTSRVSLHLRGEREYPLVPLPLPDRGKVPPPEALSQYAAVALFIERAQAARPDFTVTTANAPAIAEICARLDGLPLAIELAGARVKLLPPEALLGRLSGRLLTGGARDLEERQQTMRATIAWSEALLSPEERVLFRRLAVFVGGCTLEAAEAICAAPADAQRLGLDVLEGLSALVDQSLVQQRSEGEQGSSEPRFGMLHVIREYALEHMEASDGGREAAALRRAHAAYYLALSERAEPELTGAAAGTWLGRLEGEHDNMRAVLGWAREREAQGEHGAVETGLRLMGAVWRFWWTRGYVREGLRWAEELLEPELALEQADGSEGLGALCSAPTQAPAGLSAGSVRVRVRARAMHAGGSLALARGEVTQAQRWLEQARALAQAAGDPQTEGRALVNLGVVARYQGDWKRTVDMDTEALALFRQVDDREGIATTLNNLGVLASREGDLEGAADAFTEALALYRTENRRVSIALVLGNLGAVAWRRGELDQAEALEREALAMARDLGDMRRCAEELEQLVRTAGAAGRGERAARLFGAAAALREAMGIPLPAPDREEVEQAVAAARAALGEDAWAASFAAGQALSLEQAIAEALGEARQEVG